MNEPLALHAGPQGGHQELRYRPLFPEARDQGDPYVLRVPPGAGAWFRFYTYVTGLDTGAGTAFPAYGSDDLHHWHPLAGTLIADVTRAHWAPCVYHIEGLARPYVMLYSRAAGLGQAAHIGHTIRRADSTSPEGPFRDSGHVLTPDLDFAIDPDVYRLHDGALRIAFATDFVDDPPLGTGIVEAAVSDDLTTLQGTLRVLARAHYDWQVYDRHRKMPWKTIPGVNWDTDTVEWYTVEGPVGGLVSPVGRRVYLYSGGCYWRYYAVGALIEDSPGNLVIDATVDEATAVLHPDPATGFFAPGHCCWFRDGGHEYLMFHARYGTVDAPRQMSLARLRWTAEGLPYAVPVGAVREPPLPRMLAEKALD